MAEGVFVDEPFTVEIKDGNAILTWTKGQTRVVPLRVFRIDNARCTAALAAFDAEQGAQIVKLSERGPLFLREYVEP